LQLVQNASCWLQNFFGSHAVKGMAMSYLYLVGRILFALIFITAAPRHFRDIAYTLSPRRMTAPLSFFATRLGAKGQFGSSLNT
jgi:uncharacterized membrane protein YphA (DoxX/SURF4 family)